MDEVCRRQITDEQYADFIVDYNGNTSVFQSYCYNIVNNEYGVAYVPLNLLTRNTIQTSGYSAFPKCYGLLDTSHLEVSGVLRVQNLPNFVLRGRGVLIGIVDTGIDYRNNIFKNADNTTRIVSIWDQTIYSENAYPQNTNYGTEYSREQINEALRNENPISIVPSMDENGHGTFLAGVAAGSKDEANDFVGVAPDSELVIVKLKKAKKYIKDFFRISEEIECYQENDIMFGVKYLQELALKLGRPIAICIGLGTNQGSHDGGNNLEDYLSSVGGLTGTGIVIAAGNEGNRGHHFFGTTDPVTKFDIVELKVGENEKGLTMELWGGTPSIFSIDILSPSGEYIPRIPARLGESRDISFIFERTTIAVDYEILAEHSGDQLILIRFRDPTPGIWRFRVYESGDITSSFHIWLPMEKFISENTIFTEPNPDTVITSPGNAVIPISMAAYDHVKESLFINSSRGFARNNRVEPDLTAPGVNIYGPAPNNKFTNLTGTSAAAAIAVGVVALMLEWGIVKGNAPAMDTFAIKNFLIRGARRDPAIIYPSKEWGYGILDIFHTFESLISE